MNKNKKIEFMDREILYSVYVNCAKESIDGLENELYEYIYNYDKVEPDIKNDIDYIKSFKTIEVKSFIDFGVSALSILDNENISFSSNIDKELDYLRTYLNKCIKNKQFCNPTLFLAYVKHELHRFLPLPQYNVQNNPYSEKQISNDILNKDNETKLEAILFNIHNIDLRKDYVCKGIIDLIIVSLFEIFSKNYNIKKCQNCNRYFISKKSNANIKYCNYYSSNHPNSTCREYMSKAEYIKKRNNNNVQYKYNILYSRYNNRYSRLRDKYEHIKEIPKEIKLEIEQKLNIVNKLQNLYNEDIISKLKNNEITEDEAMELLEDFEKEVEHNGSTRNNKK